MRDNIALAQVLEDWSYWNKAPAPSVRRKVLRDQLNWASDLVWIIQGVRRCGKSTLLAQIMEAHQLNPKHCFFVNFEDPRLSDRLNSDLLGQIIQMPQTFGLPPNEKFYFFFDEIQNVEKWEKWLHTQVERPKNNYFMITGSNASLLAGELGTALTGRHRTLELYPFDFQEYRELKPSSKFENYLDDGGFPRVLVNSEPQALLREYFRDIIERDVKRHVAARSTTILTQLAKAVYESTGSETSFRKLAKVTDLSVDTIKSYVDAFSAAYLCLPCPYFTYSERKRLVRSSKYYPIDLGLHRAIISRGGLDRGKQLETAVFHELKRRYHDVSYWKEKGEVDFVVESHEGVVPYQVSWDGPKERHTNALAEFKKEFPKSNPPVFISKDNIEEFLAG